MAEGNTPEKLAALLRERLLVVADHAHRTCAPEEHLARLKAVSEEIFAVHASLKGRIDPHLDHYLTNCSYDKALAFLTETTEQKG